MGRIHLISLALLMALVVARPVMAQTPASAACLAQCQASSAVSAASLTPVRACLIRCRAGEEFSVANQNGSRASSQNAPPIAPARMAHWGAIYAAAPPGLAVGISQGRADRMMVHAQAEIACRSQGRTGCSLLTEFSTGCGVAAHALRATGLVITAHASTFRVTYVTAATGTTRADAEARALRQCRDREPSASCRVAAHVCIGR